MQWTIRVRLMPTPQQASALLDTLHTCNAAANWLSGQMSSQRIFRKFEVQKRLYTTLRMKFGLGAQPSIRVIGKVTDAYTRDRDTRHQWRSDAGQPFDARCLSWQLPDASGEKTVSILSVHGRLRRVRVIGDPADLEMLASATIGETDLLRRNGKWFLHVSTSIPEAPPQRPTGFLGVDMGVVNIATTSDGVRESGSRLNSYRKRQLRLRKRLRAKGTRSARRLLKHRRGKERRFAADTNHVISKSIVTEAERTGRGIAVERLDGIRDRVRLRKPQRVALHSWAFRQLGEFLAYKAHRLGVAFIQVDPAYTSQTCSRCGDLHKSNRRSQALFHCGRCGLVGHADHNAAVNIAQRGVDGWGEVTRPNATSLLAAGQGRSRKPIGNRGEAETPTGLCFGLDP